MPRRREVPKRQILPDPLYSSQLVTKFVNVVMKDGKKSVAEKLLYDALDVIRERTDEDQQMRTVVKMLQQGVDAPLVIDSTEPEVMKIALENNPGRAILNSVHLESGPAKLEKVAALARQHGAAMVAMCIDEEGQAETAERKVEVAARIHDLVVNQYGMSPDRLIFDTLSFPSPPGRSSIATPARK